MEVRKVRRRLRFIRNIERENRGKKFKNYFR